MSSGLTSNCVSRGTSWFLNDLTAWINRRKNTDPIAFVTGGIGRREKNLLIAAERRHIPVVCLTLFNPQSIKALIPDAVRIFELFESLDQHVSVRFGGWGSEIRLFGGWTRFVPQEEFPNPVILLRPEIISSALTGDDGVRWAAALGIGSIKALESLALLDRVSHIHLNGELPALAIPQYSGWGENSLAPERYFSVGGCRPKLFAGGVDHSSWTLQEHAVPSLLFQRGISAVADKRQPGPWLALPDLLAKKARCQDPPVSLAGIDHRTQAGKGLARLLEKSVPGWLEFPGVIPQLKRFFADPLFLAELWQLHCQSKEALLAMIKGRTGTELAPEILTLGFGARDENATIFWLELINRRFQEFAEIAKSAGGLQIVLFNGLSGPVAARVSRLVDAINKQKSDTETGPIKLVVVDIEEAAEPDLISGCDVWLDQPLKKDEPLQLTDMGQVAAFQGLPCFVPGVLIGADVAEAWQAFDFADLAALLDKARLSGTPYAQEMCRNIVDLESHPDAAELFQLSYARRFKPGSRQQGAHSSAAESYALIQAAYELGKDLVPLRSVGASEDVFAKALSASLGVSVVTRYAASPNGRARIKMRWINENGQGRPATRDELAASNFFKSRKLSEVRKEFMPRTYLEQEPFVVLDPSRCKKECYRGQSPNEALASPRPFIIVPEVIEDETQGLWILEGEPLTDTIERRVYLKAVMASFTQKISRLLSNKLEQEFRNYLTKQDLFDRAAWDMSAGGFLAGKRWWVISNMVVLFMRNQLGRFAPVKATGEVDESTHWETVSRLSQKLGAGAATLEQIYRESLRHQSSLWQSLETWGGALDYCPTKPLIVRSGELALAESDPEYRQSRALVNQLMELIKIKLSGNQAQEPVKDFMLVPWGEDGIFGFAYLSNVYSQKAISDPLLMERLNLGKFLAIGRAVANRLTELAAPENT